MTYRDTLTRLADNSQQSAVTVYALYTEGVLSRSETVARLAAIIAAANGQAASLAEVALAAELITALRRPVPVTGLRPANDLARLAKAAATVLDVAEQSDVPAAIVGRLARAEPLGTAANTYSAGMARSELVHGWTRSLSAGACQLCQWWWREGRIWPADHPFQHHKGCTCTPKPVVAQHIKETGYTRRMHRNG